MEFPDDVWALVKEYAIPRCPACKGCCAYEDMPRWLDDMSQRSPHVRPMEASHYRRMWHETENARLAGDSAEIERLRRFWVGMAEGWDWADGWMGRGWER